VANVEAVTANGGYAGTVIVNIANAGGCGAFGMRARGNKPAVSVDRGTGYSYFDIPYDDAACRAGNGELAPLTLGRTGDVVTVRSYFDGWGYVHLFRNNNGKMAELDTFAIPEAMDERFATGSGALSVHEVAPSAQDDALVYVSYYAGGFRVLKIEDDTLREVGRFSTTVATTSGVCRCSPVAARSSSPPATGTMGSTSSNTPARQVARATATGTTRTSGTRTSGTRTVATTTTRARTARTPTASPG